MAQTGEKVLSKEVSEGIASPYSTAAHQNRARGTREKAAILHASLSWRTMLPNINYTLRVQKLMVLVCEKNAGPHNESHYMERCSTEEMKANPPDLKQSVAHDCTLFTLIMAAQHTSLFLVLKTDANTQ